MTNLRSKITKLLLAAGMAAAALTALPAASAQTRGHRIGESPVTIEFRYRSWESASENYELVRRLVKRACTTQGTKLMIARLSEKVCIDGMTDLLVAQLGRPQFADAHFAATGRRIGTNGQLASIGR